MSITQHKLFPALATLCLGLLGGAVNLLPFWFLNSSEFLFGQLLVLCVLLLFGWQYALAAVAIGAIFIYSRWEHCWPSLVFALEVIWLQIVCVRANKPFFLRGILFWLLIGLALLFLFGYFVLSLPLLVIFTALAKYFINAAVYLAVVDLVGFFCLHHLWRASRLYQMLNYTVSLLIVLVVIITSIVLTNNYYARLKMEVSAQLQEDSSSITKQIEDYLDSYRRAVVLTARSIEQNVPKDVALAQLLRLHTHFRTAIVTDEQAMVTHFYPEGLKLSLLNTTTNVADRSYFSEGRYFPDGFISEMFQGRGMRSEPIVAISAPYFHEKQFKGIVEGSLIFESFERFIPKLLDNRGELVIFDQQRKVVYSSLKGEFKILDEVTEDELAQFDNSRQQYTTSQEQVFYFHSASSSALDWTIVVMLESKYVNFAAASAWGLSFVLAATIILLSSIFIRQLTRMLVQPMQRLTDHMHEFDPSRMLKMDVPPQNSFLEMVGLQQQFSQLAFKLNMSFTRLQNAYDENEALNKKLKDFNTDLEQQVTEKTEELIEAVKVANNASLAKSQFLANMSHEIRTPLNGILGLSAYLLENEKVKDDVAEQLSMIQQSARNLLLILNDILDYSKIEAGALKLDIHSVSTRKLFTGLSQVFQKTGLKTGVIFRTRLADNVPQFLMLDDLRVTQIINNLLSNAGKFTETGEINLSVEYQNELLRIDVQDTGIGMSDAQLAKLFQEFTQADVSTTRKYGGTGLGLTICKRLVELMRGKISVTSELGYGSHFSVVLPCKIGHEVQDDSVEIEVPILKDVTVLLVEDNMVNQIVVKKMLEKTQCRIETALDGIEALAKLEHNYYPVILMDCQMPNMDGFQCTRQIRSHADKYRHPYIIAITANAFEEDRLRCIQVGMDDFIAKPITAAELHRALSKSLQHIETDLTNL
ncbi:ATP-binding protein [Pseudoalteromonas fenneropenaei]|uniref:histidine kinase n=1 Tax=Pseudoalteromonas fenneropenaei TaxID=1737459 RepID=A0ABV7CQ07_9GAMM